MFDIKILISDLEVQAEIKQLKELGLSADEIAGYFEMYVDSWIVERVKAQSKKPLVLN